MERKVKLYIVSKNDTLENIADKMHCSVDEIKKLNRLIKNKLILNQPILVPFNEKTLERETTNVISKDEIITLMFLIKETFLSCIYCYGAYELFFNKTCDYLKRINNDEEKNNFIKQLLLFPNILVRKNEKQLLAFEHDLKTSLEKLSDEDNTPLNTSNLKYISEQFQLYILKVANKNYKEAEKIFTNILNSINIY